MFLFPDIVNDTRAENAPLSCLRLTALCQNLASTRNPKKHLFTIRFSQEIFFGKRYHIQSEHLLLKNVDIKIGG